MAKTYILYYEFQVTKGNHGGMAYLARELEKECTEVVALKHVHQEFRGGKVLGYLHAAWLTIYLLFKLKKGDTVFFLEYLTGNFAYQHLIGKWINAVHKGVRRFGLVHLDGANLLRLIGSKEEILWRLDQVDEVVVFGSSLKAFFRELGFTKPVNVTFHYADTAYYKPPAERHPIGLQVVFIGNLKRDYDQLLQIIKACEEGVSFHICLGKKPEFAALKAMPNVHQYGYLKEEELLKLMQKADVNLSVLEDTIGSNAITASLATGLVQVVSDVGSIRDYCSEENAVFCTSTSDFTAAISRLSANPQLLRQMQVAARNRAMSFSLSNFRQAFQLLTNGGNERK